ncbi:hypothetical protein ACIPJS_29280 [Streptomyces sp. NPDC086783]
MRLGKALATGVAEETGTTEQEADLRLVEAMEEIDAPSPEEVPVAR